ncbi:MAG: preprotein translocase subunit SecG [Clostridiaceae bacterium]|nr:preprotein translocase subunit SecG [Clostridiaceae bacterium]
MHNFLMFLEVISSIVIIVSVMMQPSKSDGLSGLVGGGGASDSHFTKNKIKTFESVMVKVTTVAAICFLITTVMLNLVK